ncbi:MAG TPA: penicillin acylase family protein [Nocardioidaceae bacterium]|nr:penicillin acylase family protein [Nocardioidaceae bacterium]
MRRPRRSPLTVTAALTGIALVAGGLVGGTVPAASGADGLDRYGTVRNILPPGQSGTVTAADLAAVGPSRQATGTTPRNFADQLEMYDALAKRNPGTLTRKDLDTLYKRSTFTPQRVERSASPKSGVHIEWDQYGVPYVNGATYDDVMYGAGYAATRDRMFLMDALRHAGQARMAEFAGDTPGNIAMDRSQLANAFYTRKEAQAQIGQIAKRYGQEGQKLARAVDAYIAGINAAQDEMCPHGLPSGPECPVEYAALQKTPQPWTRADVVYVASLVGGIFGKGGGQEYDNALWLQRLVNRFGFKKGVRIYNDLRHKNDGDAPTTSSIRTPYGGGGVDPRRPGVAMPDLGGRTAPGSGAEQDGGGPVPGGGAAPSMDLPGMSIKLPLGQHGMSNALVVGRQHTTTGRPIAVFGPQTGYFTPQLLTEQVLVGPGIKARGVSFAGTNLIVQLGRGEDYAWSATSASNDNVDTVVERLCNVDGSRPTVQSEAYRRGSRCVPMQRFEHTETTTPGAGSQQPPAQHTFLVLRTRHGLVQRRTTVGGRPVAIVRQRSTYGHEVDSAIGFARLNDPGYVHDAGSFQRAVSAIDYTFNWFYADNRDISYYSSGLLPVRAPGVDYDLPRWGNAKYDWQGWLPFRRHPRQTNPGSGYLVSWNNKTAPGFAAADDIWGYGSIYRSLALEDGLKRKIRGGAKLDTAGVTGVMAQAATEDTRAYYTLPWLLKVIGKDPKTRAARAALTSWLRHGAQRVDRDRDGHYANEQAIALFDSWWQSGNRSVAYDVLSSRLGTRLPRMVPTLLDDHPRLGVGSAWNGIAWYGYVNKDLRTLLGRQVRDPYHYSYCGGGRLRVCRQVLRRSLRAAVARVTAAQGVHGVRALTYDKSIDFIRSSTAGVVGVRPIDWQNRPTFQQVVEFTGHRPRR